MNKEITIKLGNSQKTANFSMNFIKNLQDDAKMTLDEIGLNMVNGDGFDKYYNMAHVLFAAFKAYDMKNGIPVDYTYETALEWTLDLDDDQLKEFEGAMLYATALNHSIKEMGKRKQEENLQKTTH